MNFVSEGNSIVNYDIENEKEKYYNNHIDDINYYFSEINKKNKQIIELKSVINDLKLTQEKLLNEVRVLQRKSSNYSSKNKDKILENKNVEKEQVLLSKLKKLQNENNKLKMKINKNEEKENIFYNNINNKLLKAERDIQLLSFENKNNNNIILAIQNFLFNINDKINSQKQTLIFDLSIIDSNTFIHNLQILESNIITKIDQLNNIGNICLFSSRNHNKGTLFDIDYDNINKKHYTINENNEKNRKIKNLKKIVKVRNQMKTINYINSNNKKEEKKLGFALFFNNFFDEEKKKNNKPLKAYGLRNDLLKEIGVNEDIAFDNKCLKKTYEKLDDSKINK